MAKTDEKITIKKGDFVLVDYTGRLKESREIFDTTLEEVATKNELQTEGHKFKAVYAVVGEQFSLLPGLNKQLEGKELEKEYTIAIPPEDGFGKKSAKLVQLMSLSKFKGQEIMPMPGLQINIDGLTGTIKTVSGGRVLVDFNHPLSGRELEYDFIVKKIITDDKEKLAILLEIQLGMENPTVELEGTVATVIVDSEIPKELATRFATETLRFVPSIRNIKFELKEEKKEEKPLNTNGK